MTAKLYLNEQHRLLNPYRLDLEPKSGDHGITGFQVKSIDTKNRTVRAMVSTPNQDRHGEVILPESMRTSLPRSSATTRYCSPSISTSLPTANQPYLATGSTPRSASKA